MGALAMSLHGTVSVCYVRSRSADGPPPIGGGAAHVRSGGVDCHVTKLDQSRGRRNRDSGTLRGRCDPDSVAAPRRAIRTCRTTGSPPAADTAGNHPSVVEQTFGVWLGLVAVKQKMAPPAMSAVAGRETVR